MAKDTHPPKRGKPTSPRRTKKRALSKKAAAPPEPDLATRIGWDIADGDFRSAKYKIDEQLSPATNAYWLAVRLRDESNARPADEIWNLCARVARGLALALMGPETEGVQAPLRAAVTALAKLPGVVRPAKRPDREPTVERLEHLSVRTLPKGDRVSRVQILLRQTDLALRVARRGDYDNAALVAYTSARRLFPGTPDARATVLPELAIWIRRYLKRAKPDAEGLATHAVEVAGKLTRAQAKDYFRGVPV